MSHKYQKNSLPLLINIGFGNVVAAKRVVAVVTPGSSPMKRLREEARAAGILVDATEGRRTRSMIITDSNHLILSALQAETITQRMAGGTGGSATGTVGSATGTGGSATGVSTVGSSTDETGETGE